MKRGSAEKTRGFRSQSCWECRAALCPFLKAGGVFPGASAEGRRVEHHGGKSCKSTTSVRCVHGAIACSEQALKGESEFFIPSQMNGQRRPGASKSPLFRENLCALQDTPTFSTLPGQAVEANIRPFTLPRRKHSFCPEPLKASLAGPQSGWLRRGQVSSFLAVTPHPLLG